MPDELIPIAEENGLIHEIGAFVLEEAARLATQWNRQGQAITHFSEFFRSGVQQCTHER